MHFFAALELAGGQGQLVVTEGHAFVFAARGARHRSRLATQDRLDASHQLIGVERLGQVIVGAQLQALDTAQFVALGGEHDDRNLVVRATQAAAGGQAVFAGQHQVEDDQVEHFARQQAIHLLSVRYGAGAVALADEKTLQQAAEPRIVVNDKNFFAFSSLCSAAHWMLL
ncbi:hypothetical protein D3C78_1031530 [compost metagenome]